MNTITITIISKINVLLSVCQFDCYYFIIYVQKENGAGNFRPRF